MNFLSRLFGGKKKVEDNSPEGMVQNTLAGLIELAGFELQMNSSSAKDDRGDDVITVELSGADEDLLKDREGQLIEAMQLLAKRVLQHRLPEDRSNVVIDCNGFRDESNQALIDLVEKLKNSVLQKGRPMYVRPLPPKDRKTVHQYLASDARVKSRSVGDGMFKKIKIFPAKSKDSDVDHDVE